jgi:hypothetical protein
MLTLFDSKYPRWKKISQEKVEFLNWKDSSALEISSNHALRNSKRHLKIQLQDGEYLFDSQHLTLEKDSETFKLQREEGCSVSYMFDRKYEFYLCTEEFIFPTYEYFQDFQNGKLNSKLSIQSIVLLDGEIVYNVFDKRYNYTIYDIVTFSKDSNSNSSCYSMSIENKLKIIKNCVIIPHYFYHKDVVKNNPPHSLHLIMKHFYPKEFIKDILNLIVKDPKSGEYFYKGFNKNDGLVFTPDDHKYYKFCPGANHYLLKWKWTDKLTCDFLAYQDPTNPEKYALHYVKKISFNTIFQSLSKNSVFYKNVIFPDLKLKECVVECLFDRENEKWVVLCLREDKTKGNGFNVITNTLENVIENLTKEELINYLLNDTNQNLSIKNDKEFIEEVQKNDLYCHFEIQKNRNDQYLYLRCQHVLPKKEYSYDYGKIW